MALKGLIEHFVYPSCNKTYLSMGDILSLIILTHCQNVINTSHLLVNTTLRRARVFRNILVIFCGSLCSCKSRNTLCSHYIREINRPPRDFVGWFHISWQKKDECRDAKWDFCLVHATFVSPKLRSRYFVPGLFHYLFTLPAKYGMFGKYNGNTRIWHFDLQEMAWHQPQSNIVTSMQISCIALWAKKIKLWCPKLKIHNRIYHFNG